MATLNLIAVAFSACLFVLSAVAMSVWVPAVLPYTAAGLGVGGVLGFLGLALTHWELREARWHYTPKWDVSPHDYRAGGRAHPVWLLAHLGVVCQLQHSLERCAFRTVQFAISRGRGHWVLLGVLGGRSSTDSRVALIDGTDKPPGRGPLIGSAPAAPMELTEG